MSINSKLVTFSQQELVIGYSETEREKIDASLAQLEKVLKDKLKGEIKEIIRFGSYTRNTILPRKYDSKSDVDLMVVFDTVNGKKAPGTYRKNLLDIVSVAYPNSVSSKDFPAVKLELNHIMFDIVPAYSEEFLIKTYYIPDSGDGWRNTKPNDINDTLTGKNKEVGNNTVRNGIRLCKHWNAGSNYPLESYLMEKDILNVGFWFWDDTYSGFIKSLKHIAGSRPGVKQALEYIEKYKGENNEEKQFEWLQKLLPGLK